MILEVLTASIVKFGQTFLIAALLGFVGAAVIEWYNKERN